VPDNCGPWHLPAEGRCCIPFSACNARNWTQLFREGTATRDQRQPNCRATSFRIDSMTWASWSTPSWFGTVSSRVSAAAIASSSASYTARRTPESSSSTSPPLLTSCVTSKAMDEHSERGRVARVFGEAHKLGSYGGEFCVGVVAVDGEQGEGCIGIDAEPSHEDAQGSFDDGAGADGSGDGIPGGPFSFGADR
jgi:hypothetical protein